MDEATLRGILEDLFKRERLSRQLSSLGYPFAVWMMDRSMSAQEKLLAAWEVMLGAALSRRTGFTVSVESSEDKSEYYIMGLGGRRASRAKFNHLLALNGVPNPVPRAFWYGPFVYSWSRPARKRLLRAWRSGLPSLPLPPGLGEGETGFEPWMEMRLGARVMLRHLEGQVRCYTPISRADLTHETLASWLTSEKPEIRAFGFEVLGHLRDALPSASNP